MREALAHSDHDFVVAEPRRRRPQQPPKPQPRPRRGIVWLAAAFVRLMFRLSAYPNRILGGLVFALVIAIAVNALLLQGSRHPAPLFHRPVADALQVPAPQTAQTQSAQTIVRVPLAPVTPAPAPQPQPAPQPTNSDQIGQLLTTDGSSQSSNDNDAGAPQGAAAPQPANHDAIAHLLTAPAPHEASHETVTKDASSRDVPADERPKTILAVQRALLKLGYVVKPDGEMGAATRHALEQYERDHGLAEDPHLSVKLLHRLATETGIAMN